MLKVRKDVIKKLMSGLENSREKAIKHDASIPKSYKYRTSHADHFIYLDDVNNTYYCNSIYYDGTRAHISIKKQEEQA